MKKSRSSSKKRSAKRKPAKRKPAKRKPAKRKVLRKPKKTAKSRSAAARRRTGAKARTRAGAKKTRARKTTKKATRAGGRKRPVSKAKKTSAKKTVRAVARRTVSASKPVLPVAPVVPANELKAGVVTHYYSHLSVAVVAVTDRRLQLGNRIHIKGHTSDFYQTVGSMQIEHDTISVADVGQTMGLKVADHAREHDTVYLVT